MMDLPKRNENPYAANGATKKIKVRQKNSNKSMNSQQSNTSNNSSSAEEEASSVPLSARDSRWADLEFYKRLPSPDFKEDDDEEEVQIVEIDGQERVPILLLFPGLREVYPKTASIVSGTESTTNVTKMLVGQKADFSYLKTSRKLRPTDLKLPAVIEKSSQEAEEEEEVKENATENTSKGEKTKDEAVQDIVNRMALIESTITENEETDNSEGTLRKNKRRLTKKKPKEIESIDSNFSISSIKKRKESTASKSKTKILRKSSTHSSFGDDENELT